MPARRPAPARQRRQSDWRGQIAPPRQARPDCCAGECRSQLMYSAACSLLMSRPRCWQTPPALPEIARCGRRSAERLTTGRRQGELHATSNAFPGIAPPQRHSALYFPRLKQPNPLHDNLWSVRAVRGAGVFARRTPAAASEGAEARTRVDMCCNESVPSSTTERRAEPTGIDRLRLPVIGRVVWGARTLDGADGWRPSELTSPSGASHCSSKRACMRDQMGRA